MAVAVLNGLAVSGPAGVTGRSDTVQLTVTGNATQTSNLFTIRNSTPTDLLWVTPDAHLASLSGVAIQATAGGASLVLANNAKTVYWGFNHQAGGQLRLRSVSAGEDVVEFATDGSTLWYKSFSTTATLRLLSDTAQLQFGAALDVNLRRKDASTLKSDDEFEAAGLTATDGTNAGRLASSGGITYFQSGPLGASGSQDILIGGMWGASEYAVLNASKLRVSSGVIKLGGAEDTDLFRATTNTLATNSLFDASVAGLRTKHQSGTTPTGGTSGEVRVGTDRVWFQDAGTWKSISPTFAAAAKWMTD